MKLVQATVKFQARNVNTRYGEKCNAVFTFADGEETTIWGPANHPPLFALSKGEQVTLGLNANGKYSLVESEPVEPTKPNLQVLNPTPGQAPVTDFLTEQCDLYRQAYLVVLKEMSGLVEGEESLRAIATTLYLQAQKELPNLKARVEEFTPYPVAPVTRPVSLNGHR